ncbi:hypothetical protein C8F01DRAFT_979130, partial [Mycena amicta]
RCPDGIFCETLFDQVLQQIGSKIDLSLVYVAHLNRSEPVFGVTCMHGPGECAGNVQQLCAAKYLPANWWNFVKCQNSHGRFQVGLPEVAVECGEAVGIEWERSQAGYCAGKDGRGTEGIELLKASAKRGKSLEIEKSCTVLINHRKVCVRDETWQECETRPGKNMQGGNEVDDFIRQINEEFERLNGGQN